MIADQEQYKLDRNKVIQNGDLSSFREFCEKYGIKNQDFELFKKQAVWQ
jgi:hypothetical protein